MFSGLIVVVALVVLPARASISSSPTSTATAGGGGGGGGATPSSVAGGGGATPSSVAGGGGATPSSVAGGSGVTPSSVAGGGGVTPTTAGDGGGVSPTPTKTTPASSSVVVDTRQGPEVVLSLTVNIDCSGSKEDTLKANLQEDILEVFRKAGFPTKSVTTQSSSCNSPLKITLVISFYTGIPTNIIVEQVFEDALKAGQIRKLTVANTEFSLTFSGVTISYQPKSGECDRVCCNGPGGPLTVEGSCTPTDKCAGIEPADKQETGHCPGESKDTCKCGSKGFHNSNFALIILLGIATFMKNTF